MKTQIRHLVIEALYPIKAYSLPAVCERYGLDPGESDEAFSSKKRYIACRLENISDEQVLAVARKVIDDYPNDTLLSAIEEIENSPCLITDVTRHQIAKALNEFSLSGDKDLVEMLRKHWPSIMSTDSHYNYLETLADDIRNHSAGNGDWSNVDVLNCVGFISCSQSKLFKFIEDILHPIRRDQKEQRRIVDALNPILRRDGYFLTPEGRVSGYPLYVVRETIATGIQPADQLISDVLISFDESGVHHAWTKALDRRRTDPEGAITAAKTLLETVCKHILDKADGIYGDNDDLPKLYNSTAEMLNLAPNQHTEKIFKIILGNCQSIVGSLASLRNRLGDSHGQGKKCVKPLARHAELAVNLSGSIAMFLISTWAARQISGSRQETEERETE